MSSSNQLKGVYRITSTESGETYTIDFQAAGRRKMNGTITGTNTQVAVFIQPKERPDGLRVEIGATILFGTWVDDAHRLLEMISSSKTTPFVGEWERLADDVKGGWSVPLQWMREHNTSGTRREKTKALTEFATMLRDMAPDNAFDPRTMWDPEEDARQAAAKLEAAAKASGGGDKGKKKGKGSKSGGSKKNKAGGGKSKKEEIIARNVAKMEKDVVE